MYNTFGRIVEDATVAASGTYVKNIDLLNRTTVRLGIFQRFAAASAGLNLTLLPGMGPTDGPDAVGNRYATDDINTVAKPDLAAPIAAGPNFESFTIITIEQKDLSRYLGLKFTNPDGVNACTRLDIWIDV